MHARVIDVPVTLVDLGPTILDLFGLDTPATFLGQSLVPLLTGETVDLTRPRFVEGRLRRKFMLPDGIEAIEDLRRKTVEVYDLKADPGETRNLWDADPVRSDVALAALRAFFDAHARTAEAYEPPYEP
jgi:arylsulfatase A-like enzyme